MVWWEERRGRGRERRPSNAGGGVKSRLPDGHLPVPALPLPNLLRLREERSRLGTGDRLWIWIWIWISVWNWSCAQAVWKPRRHTHRCAALSFLFALRSLPSVVARGGGCRVGGYIDCAPAMSGGVRGCDLHLSR